MRGRDEMSGAIQEVIDRPDWATGNSLRVIVRGGGNSVGAEIHPQL